VITRRVAAFVVACLLTAAAAAQAPSPRLLRVITFDGGWNLPLWAAQRQGFLAAQGLEVQVAHTPNSTTLVASLFDGRADIALALVDNLVATQEGQGEAQVGDNPDLFAFMGSDGGFLSVVGARGIGSWSQLKGKTLAVDAMTTGAAFVLRELAERNGLGEGEVNYVRAGGTANRYRDLLAGKHEATLLRTPFDLQAMSQGLSQLALAETLGPYQGTTGIARRSWARDNEAALVGFIRAWRNAVDWLYDRAHREVVEALLVASSRDMTPALARRSYDLLLADKGGLSRDLVPDAAGMRTVLQLRSKYGQPRKTLDDAGKYVDLTYHQKAFGQR
jgi:ABC-type nitrate/sulfonate/bicarbonate transport system substrate-binding protein